MNLEIIFTVCIVHFVFDFVVAFYVVNKLPFILEELESIQHTIRSLDRDIVNSKFLSKEILQQLKDNKRADKAIKEFMEINKK